MVSKSQWKKFKAEQKLHAQGPTSTPSQAQPAQDPKKIEPATIPQGLSSKPAITPALLSLQNATDFPNKLHNTVLDKNYFEAFALINTAIGLKLSELKEEGVLKDIRTTIAGLTDQHSPKTNTESVKAGISLIKKCAELGIIYEPDADNARVTQTAIGVGQNYCPADTAYAIIEIQKAGKLLILPSTIKVTVDKLQFKNATPENTKACRDLVIHALDHFLDKDVDDDIALVSRSLQKLGNPNILPGEENLLDVANRITAGYEIAETALNKQFTFVPEKRGTRLDCFIDDLRKAAIKLRLLGDVIKSGNSTPRIRTNISLQQDELKAINLKQDSETGEQLIQLSDKLLLKAVRLANNGLPAKQATFANTILSTIKECEPDISVKDAQEIAALAKNLIDGKGERPNPKTIEMIATYLASQKNGELSAIELTVTAYRKGKDFEFMPQSFGFICTKTKNIILSGALKEEWAHLAAVKGKSNLSRNVGVTEAAPTKQSVAPKQGGGMFEGKGVLEKFGLKSDSNQKQDLKGGTK